MAFPRSRVLPAVCQQANHPPPILHALNWDIKIFQHCWYFARQPLLWLPVCPCLHLPRPLPNLPLSRGFCDQSADPPTKSSPSNNVHLTPIHSQSSTDPGQGVRKSPPDFKSLKKISQLLRSALDKFWGQIRILVQ